MTLPVKPTGPDELRSLFNDRRFYERTQTGELSAAVVHESEAPTMGVGAMSQMVEYWDGDVRVALVHHYVDKRGHLLASRKPDPKWLIVDGVLYQKARRKI